MMGATGEDFWHSPELVVCPLLANRELFCLLQPKLSL